jgi:hypothetical protein
MTTSMALAGLGSRPLCFGINDGAGAAGFASGSLAVELTRAREAYSPMDLKLPMPARVVTKLDEHSVGDDPRLKTA